MTVELGFWDGVAAGFSGLILVGMAALFVKWYVEMQIDDAKREMKEWVRDREGDL